MDNFTRSRTSLTTTRESGSTRSALLSSPRYAAYNFPTPIYDDIRTFMPWILTSDQAAQYNLTYAGKQHVDDLDTYVFHVEPKQFEKNRRYFQGKIWVDDRDVQMVKLCGKSVPEATTKKKKKTTR